MFIYRGSQSVLLRYFLFRFVLGIKNHRQFMEDLSVILSPFDKEDLEMAARRFVSSLESS